MRREIATMKEYGLTAVRRNRMAEFEQILFEEFIHVPPSQDLKTHGSRPETGQVPPSPNPGVTPKRTPTIRADQVPEEQAKIGRFDETVSDTGVAALP
jgi:hypothetical protein